MNFGELTESAALRSGVPTADGRYGTVGDRVNEALAEMTQRNPTGWDWLWREVTIASVADQASYPFATISGLLDGYPVTRVVSVDLLADDDIHQPLDRISRREGAGYEFSGGGPFVGWTVEGQALRIMPAPRETDIEFGLRVIVAEKPLVGNLDVPLMPALHHSTLLHLARSLIYEQKQDDERATSARNLYNGQIPTMLAASRPYGGPGRPPLES